MSFKLPDNVRHIPIIARVTEADVDVDLIRTAMKRSGREASLSPVGPNGHPRMLKITAWMCHAGRPNRNRDAFTEDDLKAAVENGLFGAPYFGAVDWNHDFHPYGVFYSAKYAYDPVAEAWGVLAEGAIFAWRYEELADRILAMQQRNEGLIAVSMSCLPGDIETAKDEDGTYWILRNPTFFTCSLLDVDPADPFGRAVTTENVEETPEEREDKLTELALASIQPPVVETEENEMDIEQLLADLVAAQGLTEEQATAVREALASVVSTEPAGDEPVVNGPAADEPTADNDRIAELEAAIASLTTARDEAIVARESAAAELATANSELTELQAYQTRREAEDAEIARTARRDTRMAQLSEATKAALEALSVEAKDRLVGRWTDMDEDEWKVTLASLTAGGAGKGYGERSKAEGTLSGAADSNVKYESYRYRSESRTA
jgi:hypothetical protein